MTDDGIGESNTVPLHEEVQEDDGSIAEEIEVEPVREPTPEPRRRRGPTPTRGATGDVILQVHIANIFLERVLKARLELIRKRQLWIIISQYRSGQLINPIIIRHGTHVYPSFQSFCQRYARLCKKGLRRFLEFLVLIKVDHQFFERTRKTAKFYFFFFEFLWHLAAGMKTTTFRFCLFSVFILGAGRSIGSYLFTRRISEQLDLPVATQRQDPSWVDFESWDRKTKIAAYFGLFVQVRSQSSPWVMLIAYLRSGIVTFS